VGRRGLLALIVTGVSILLAATAGCVGRGSAQGDLQPEPEKRSFDGERAYPYALEQCEIGPRPPGSSGGWATGDYILAKLEELGWDTATQEFDYRGVRLRNVIGKHGDGPVVIVGAHYDTRPVADRDTQHPNEPVPGGNDGASGVAVLLELADVLAQYELQYEVWLVFFDGEDSGNLGGWPFSVGSAYMAENLTVDPVWVVVVDMVGDRDQQLYYEGNSDPLLRERLWDIAAGLGYEQFLPEVGRPIIDDHLPFVNAGIPAVDIIDIDYPYWHTVQDTCDKVSADSLERVGRVLEEFVTRGG
jgi:Zn-dependent M28 family amino/carboxypeptidase